MASSYQAFSLSRLWLGFSVGFSSMRTRLLSPCLAFVPSFVPLIVQRGGRGIRAAPVADIWQQLFVDERKNLQKKDEDLRKKDEDLRKEREKVDDLIAESKELIALKEKLRGEKLQRLSAADVRTYRQMVDHVIIDAVGDTSRQSQLGFLRSTGVLLQRYKSEPAITRGLTQNQLKNGAFADKMATDFYDLYDRICGIIHVSMSPDRVRFRYGEIDLSPLTRELSEKELLLLYHFFDLNAYPVIHPIHKNDASAPASSSNDDTASPSTPPSVDTSAPASSSDDDTASPSTHDPSFPR